MAEVNSLSLHRGVEALRRVTWAYRAMNDHHYPAMVSILAESLRELSKSEDSDFREGYLRALTDLISLNVDGCGVNPNDQGWDPIAATALGFEVPVCVRDGDTADTSA